MFISKQEMVTTATKFAIHNELVIAAALHPSCPSHSQMMDM